MASVSLARRRSCWVPLPHLPLLVAVEAAAAETGTALVPILTRRLEATRLAAEAAFPRTQPFATSVSDGEGWHAGTRFADVVDLDARRRLKRRPA